MAAIGETAQCELSDEGSEESGADDDADLGLSEAELVTEVAEQGDDRCQRAHRDGDGDVVGEQPGAVPLLARHDRNRSSTLRVMISTCW